MVLGFSNLGLKGCRFRSSDNVGFEIVGSGFW